MTIGRRDLLIEGDRNKVIDRSKLTRQLDEGAILSNMKESRGWKLLYGEFIDKNMQLDRLLSASPIDLADIRAEIRILNALMRFIDSRIKNAEEAANTLKP